VVTAKLATELRCLTVTLAGTVAIRELLEEIATFISRGATLLNMTVPTER
jgi:hypothetical protein